VQWTVRVERTSSCNTQPLVLSIAFRVYSLTAPGSIRTSVSRLLSGRRVEKKASDSRPAMSSVVLLYSVIECTSALRKHPPELLVASVAAIVSELPEYILSILEASFCHSMGSSCTMQRASTQIYSIPKTRAIFIASRNVAGARSQGNSLLYNFGLFRCPELVTSPAVT
jgi:hypothetical protein